MATPPEQTSSDSNERSFSIRMFLHSFGACGVSMIVHCLILLLLAFVTLDDEPPQLVAKIFVPTYDDQPVDEVIDFELDPIVVSDATASSAEAISDATGTQGQLASAMGMPQLDAKMSELLTESTEIRIEAPALLPTSIRTLNSFVPDGAVGDHRFIVDNIEQAMSQITKEIADMIEKHGQVMVVWCFDMSESMKNDRQEIRNRVDQVYAELKLAGRRGEDKLKTAVTSYGSQFFQNTRLPTSDMSAIRQAIDSVQIDDTGTELMCAAVEAAIGRHHDIAKRENRKMAMVLLTDESGNRKNNDDFLERAIAIAQASDCRIYVMGREAIFGYPHARMRWLHPQTNRIYHLLVDRGPETAFAEQLQTNGFHRRWDSFSSGFGPYEQARMAAETNGIFFMLPTVEPDIVGGESDKRRYELQSLRAYKPDLRAKLEALADRDDQQRYPLRGFIWKVVDDLNPLSPPGEENNPVYRRKANELEMRMSLPLDLNQFVKAVRESQVKAAKYLTYLSAAEKVLVDAQQFREQEPSPRWQANYDLILAQIVAYQARIYEYGVSLEYFLRTPREMPPKYKTVNGNPMVLVHWDLRSRRKTFAEDTSSELPYPNRELCLEYIERSTRLFQMVIDTHPGTPWAERAEAELSRGFGLDMGPEYDNVIRTNVSNPIPVPKL